MFQRMLVPLDGSEGAERAIPVAARIARASGGSLVFLRVVALPEVAGSSPAGLRGEIIARPEAEASEKDLADAASYLEAVIDAYADELAGLAIDMDVADGAASPLIFSAAYYEHVDLIVMCSRGETGLRRWMLGSVAQQAVRHSPVAVLVLNEHGTTLPAPGAAHSLRVLVPLDGSKLAETALGPAAQLVMALAAPAQGELHLLHVVDLPSAFGKMKSQAHITDSMQEEARQEAETSIKAVAERCATTFAGFKLNVSSSTVVITDVAGTVIKQAEQTGGTDNTARYDVIALATHGRGGLRRLVLGSVTEHLLGSTKLPLLVVRPQKAETEGEEPGDTGQV